MNASAEILRVVVDCHNYPWHERLPFMTPEWEAEQFADGEQWIDLVGMAERYGVMLRHLPSDLSWDYEVTGPRDHLAALLFDCYCGNEDDVAEILRYAEAV